MTGVQTCALPISAGANVTFDTGSFDYSVFQLVIVASAGQDGVRLQNSAQLQGTRFEVRGNFTAGAGNTGAVLAFDRGNTAGTSQISGQVLVDVECDGSSGLGHYSIYVGNTYGAGPITGTGVLNFNNRTVSFQGYHNPNNFTWGGFAGVVNDTVLGLMSAGDALVIAGGTDLSEVGGLATALFLGNLYFEAGDIQTCQLASGNTSLTFNGVGTWGKRIDIFFAQPASGAAGTVTWPANVTWAAGSPPVLSAVNSAVDRIQLVYVPSASKWFGTHVVS